MGIFNKKIDLIDFYPNNIVDIHSHLLPGIDDGSKNISDSINLIEKLERRGITNFRTTPHVMGDVWENSSKTIKEKEAELKKALLEKGYNHINISAAAEYMLDENFSTLLANDDILTLKDKYVLVEMSFFSPPPNLNDLLFEIQLKGYIPVLAHPERYSFYHENLENYEKLINAGCLFQLNLLSLTDHYGKHVSKASYELLKRDMYTFVGTDTHNKFHLHTMKEIANKKNKKLLTPLFKNNIDVFSF